MGTTRTAAKNALRAAIAAPGVRHGLRWFLRQRAIPQPWRDLALRKVAKRARWGHRSFVYTTPAGEPLRFLHTGTPNYLYWLDEYEPSTTNLFCTLATGSTVILDIGAADGVYSVLGAAANRAARILAFEPGRGAAATCAANLDLNQPLTRHVELHALALGERDAETTLFVAGESGGTSSLDPTFREATRTQDVTVRAGDGLLAELAIDHVDLIKLDTEATEPAVLRGLAGCLERDHPDVICEVLHGRTEEALDALVHPLGYDTYWIAHDGLHPRAQIVGDPTYRSPNYLFTTRRPAELTARGVTIKRGAER